MAQSKNNRKKSKKKKNPNAAKKTGRSSSVQRIRDWNQEQVIKFALLGIMVLGFVIAMIGGTAALIGYPIAFFGALISMGLTQWDTTNHKITKVVLCAFCILSAIEFIQLIIGRA